MNVGKLVFIDETWTSTKMTRRYGRALRGKRCIGSAPHGHWKTTTLVGALRRHRLTAPMVTDGIPLYTFVLAKLKRVIVFATSCKNYHSLRWKRTVER
jgi:hypothetical protein